MMWEILGKILSTGVDFKRVKNNLQGFKGNLYPRGYMGGGGTPGVRTGHIPDGSKRGVAIFLFILPVCAGGS
jgi:hypothetical protein